MVKMALTFAFVCTFVFGFIWGSETSNTMAAGHGPGTFTALSFTGPVNANGSQIYGTPRFVGPLEGGGVVTIDLLDVDQGLMLDNHFPGITQSNVNAPIFFGADSTHHNNAAPRVTTPWKGTAQSWQWIFAPRGGSVSPEAPMFNSGAIAFASPYWNGRSENGESTGRFVCGIIRTATTSAAYKFQCRTSDYDSERVALEISRMGLISPKGGLQLPMAATGSSEVNLGVNSPASTSVPYTWLQMMAPDGALVWIPAWK